MSWSRFLKSAALVAVLALSAGSGLVEARGWRGGGWQGSSGYGHSYYGNGYYNNGYGHGYNNGGYGRSYYGNGYGRGYSNGGWGFQYSQPYNGGYGQYYQGGYYVRPQYYNSVTQPNSAQCPGTVVQAPVQQYATLESVCCTPVAATCCPSTGSATSSEIPAAPAVPATPTVTQTVPAYSTAISVRPASK